MTFHGSTVALDHMPPSDRWPHGTRARYVGGRCRCDACRLANNEYAKAREAAKRRGEHNGLVPAERVLAKLEELRQRGVGVRAIVEATGLSRSVLQGLRNGRRGHLRAQSYAKLCAIDVDAARLGGALVPAGPTHELLRRLVSLGYTRAELAERLGRLSPALQFKDKHITARSARAVAALYVELKRERAHDRAFCADCGHAHTPENRQRLIARMARELSPEEIREAWPCFYGITPGHSSGMRVLMRDLAEIRDRVATGRPAGAGRGRGVG